ncbi:hypothetical protein M0812_23125 [Anaeramoeba flamelloides]|uniref:Ankyrin repeat protein n=1 Tax=Anaeramoeba flamelloides TaxID=1746091 RepID=A0AAV7YKV9_9EUKA|nr:hypothetical protein M0812_23125 [Anaeramoeba flamelloides]
MKKFKSFAKKESDLSQMDINSNLPIQSDSHYAYEFETFKLLGKSEIKDTPLHIATRFYQLEDGNLIIQYLIDQ